MTTPQMDREAFMRQIRTELETLLEEVADAVDNAPAGRIIRDSEEKVRDAFAEFRKKTFEQALQMKGVLVLSNRNRQTVMESKKSINAR